MKTPTTVILIVLALTGWAGATHPPAAPDLIVPGKRIGPATLGMNAEELTTAMTPITNGERAGCPVEAVFTKGRASELRTTWGGACQTSEGLQVGIEFGQVLWWMGAPAKQREDARYVDAAAVWFAYRRGIAFRIVIPDGARAADGVIVCGFHRIRTPTPG